MWTDTCIENNFFLVLFVSLTFDTCVCLTGRYITVKVDGPWLTFCVVPSVHKRTAGDMWINTRRLT